MFAVNDIGFNQEANGKDSAWASARPHNHVREILRFAQNDNHRSDDARECATRA
jgi:hypothetical protein